MIASTVVLLSFGLASASIGDGPAKLVARRIMNHTEDEVKFSTWGYGQSIIIDAMLTAAERLDGMEGDNDVLVGWVNPVLDGFLNTEGEIAYNLSHGLSISPGAGGPSIGDKVGRPPAAYLHRALYYNRSSVKPPAGYHGIATDLEVARRAVDEYVLTWPIRWKDGVISRDLCRKNPGWNETDEHQYIWSDDVYMGLTLPARMIVAGLETPDHKYAKFIAEQHALFASYLRDKDDLYWHGYDAKRGIPSCCKWGRANGWNMLAHVEVLQALAGSTWEGAEAAMVNTLTIFQRHARALVKLQPKSGRWHQLVDIPSTFQEMSCTAMFVQSMMAGVDAGWLQRDEFAPAIAKGVQSILRFIDEDGTVQGICNGWGIHPTEASYNQCPTKYGRSAAGGLGAVLKALVMAADWEADSLVV